MKEIDIFLTITFCKSMNKKSLCADVLNERFYDKKRIQTLKKAYTKYRLCVATRRSTYNKRQSTSHTSAPTWISQWICDVIMVAAIRIKLDAYNDIFMQSIKSILLPRYLPHLDVSFNEVLSDFSISHQILNYLRSKDYV